ncbi:MAG: pimeloyl-ACP methyl ester carboxylesterase [Acidimicrobiales bacterium]|jgi:pimeloyl-ACP methyl ester carboxylesterase
MRSGRTITRPRRGWSALIGATVSAAALLASITPVGATDGVAALSGTRQSTPTFGALTDGQSEPVPCAVEFDIELVNVDHVHSDGSDHKSSPIVTLDKPLPTGRVLTSGVTTDPDHLDDQIDYTTDLSQFEEEVRVRFYAASGKLIAETEPTPDLPDITPYAPFAVPSVDLSEPAVAIQIVHGAAGPGNNSVSAPCINFQSVSSESPASDFVQLSLCPIDGPAPLPPSAICGFFAVPEDREDPDARHINIAFGVMPGDGLLPDPLVYLEGGPGGAPLNRAGLLYQLAMGPASGGRDVIFVDQRGTGYAYPNLNCVQQQDFADDEPEFESQEELLTFQRQLLAECHPRLVAEGVDLNGYTTIENGADIADLRVALGVAEWNLFGGSYGTDLALTIMRDRPEGVRSVVLDSVFPPEVNVTAGEDAIGFLKRLDAIVARCDVDPACATAFPDLRGDLVAAVDNTMAEPQLLTGTAVEFIFGTPEVMIDGSQWLALIDVSFPNPYIAALINGLANDDAAVRHEQTLEFLRNTMFNALGLPPEILSEFQADFRGVPGPGETLSDGFYFTVMCAEEFPFSEGATVYDGPGWSDAIYAVADEIAEIFAFTEECAIFDVEPEVAVVNEPVVSDLPALVLYTDADFQTAPEWSELTAASLPNSDLVFFNNLGHVVTFYDTCPQIIIAQFLGDPGGPLDTSCTARLPPVTYAPAMPLIGELPPLDELLAQLDDLFGPPPAEEPPSETPVPEEEPPSDAPVAGEEPPPDGPVPEEEPPTDAPVTEEEAEPEGSGPSDGGPVVEAPPSAAAVTHTR